MKTMKASNKNGQSIIARARYNEGFHLSDIYGTYSQAKLNGWNWCYEEYLNTENHEHFHICGHNQMMFSVSWEGTEDGEPIIRYETAHNSYKVYLNR